jgi:hypothetical protein
MPTRLHPTKFKIRFMKRGLIFIASLLIGPASTKAQTPRMDFWQFPERVVEHLWEMGVRGELLTTNGWDTASGFYTKPNPEPTDRSFDVYSNFYGLGEVSKTADKADVTMEYSNGGRVDSNLRYTPPPKVNAFKTGLIFHLVLTPTYIRMFGPDGKTEVERKPTGDSAWEIEGPSFPPWTTVNTAIRYVLEMRNKTNDPVIKENADETITKLLTLH